MRGLVIMDFVTMAPNSDNGKNCDSSWPELAQPLAVKIGFENRLLPIFVEKSKTVMVEKSLQSVFCPK